MPSWFKEEWIDSNQKATAVYTTLLLIRSELINKGFLFVMNSEKYATDILKSHIIPKFQNKKNLDDVKFAVRETVNEVKANGRKDRGKIYFDKQQIDEIELKYFEVFDRSYLANIKFELVSKCVSEIENVLWSVRAEMYDVLDKTPAGTIFCKRMSVKSIQAVESIPEIKAKEVLTALESICISKIETTVFPAPILAKNFINNLEKIAGGYDHEAIARRIAKKIMKLDSLYSVASSLEYKATLLSQMIQLAREINPYLLEERIKNKRLYDIIYDVIYGIVQKMQQKNYDSLPWMDFVRARIISDLAKKGLIDNGSC